MLIGYDTKIDNKNFKIYCIKAYQNFQFLDEDEVEKDLSTIDNLKKLFTRFENSIQKQKSYKDTSKLVRIILNTVITLTNIFGNKHTVRILFFKLKNNKEELKTIFTFLNIMPEFLYNIGNEEIIHNKNIKENENLRQYLGHIKNGKKD